MRKQEAHRLYQDILRAVESKMGSATTYSSQLDRFGTELLGSEFAGAFPCDRTPTLTEETPYAIINLGSHDTEGSHWIALMKWGKRSILYDSFGRRIKLCKWKKSNGRVAYTDKDAEQKLSEDNCGQRSLAFLAFGKLYGGEAAMKI